MTVDPELAKELKKADLRYISDSTRGFIRKKQNEKFIYFDTDEKRIDSEQVLARIEKLSIPPAWSDVWICPSPSGYLQATGFDEKKRKQYIYHEDWKKISQENKFNKMTFFAEVLPKIRNKVMRDMAEEELERDKIVATVVWLLGQTMIRIGNEEYVKENDSFGLTTLRSRHVKVRGKEVTFEFKGKSGVQHSVKISHPRIVKIIKECIDLPGYELFQYLDDDGEKHTVDSADVNEYLKNLTGEDVTAKDFRTWGGTVLCAETLHKIGYAQTEADEKKNISLTIKKVCQHLRNTMAVCRSYYIHPVVIETYQKKLLIPHFDNVYKGYDRQKAEMAREEYATLTLLHKYS